MPYRLVLALDTDEEWLERLRRDVYQELFEATFGGWDEARHERQFRECWKQGGISVIEVDGVRVGMIQLFERPDGVEVGEIQILPGHQNLGIGTRVLRGMIERAHEQRRKVVLSVGLKNERAYRLYQRLGFHRTSCDDTHNHMSCDSPVIGSKVQIDEPIQVVDYDPVWAEWYAADADELNRVFGARLRDVQHFGSTSVPEMAAKPIIDVLVAPAIWPLTAIDRETFKSRGYEYLGEAGVPGREYFRRRSAHDTNLAVVGWHGTHWQDNLLLRDYLRVHAGAATQYAQLKNEAWRDGARTLIAYSNCKAHHVAALLEAAKVWQARLT